MNTIEIPERGICATIPSSWSELSPADLRFVVRTHYESTSQQRSPLDFNVRVLYHFLKLSRTSRSIRWERLYPELAEERNVNVYNLCDKCLAWMFAGDKASLSYDSITSPLPKVRVGLFTTLVGPGDLCLDLTFGEYRAASNALHIFLSSGDDDDLNNLLLCLFRRPSRSVNLAGRKVRPLDATIGVRERRAVAKMKPWQKQLALLFFSACVNYLQSSVIIVDGEEVDMNLLYEGTGESKTPYGLNDVLSQLAKEGSMGTMDNVDAQPLPSVLREMWHNWKENKRYEEQRKNH